MSGVRMQVGIRDDAFALGLRELEAAGLDLSLPMDEIGGSLVASTLLRFERGVAPDGTPWPPSIRARLSGGQTLIDSGRLRDSLTHESGQDWVQVGTNVLYAAVHQLGATIRAVRAKALVFVIPGVGFRRKAEVTIPARPFLGVSDDDEDEVLAILRDHLRGAAW